MNKNTHTAMAVFGQDETKNINSNQNENLMKNENKKIAGISHPAANTANLGNNIDKNSLDYLNEKVDTRIVGVAYPFHVCRWMMDIAVHCGTRAQKNAFARLTGIGYNWDNFKGYSVRLMFAPEESGMLRKDIKHIKNLVKEVRKSDEPYADAFISRMEDLIVGFTGLLNVCVKKNEIAA